MVGLAQHHQLGAVLGVEVVQPLGPELLERALADHAANLVLGHAAMQRGGDNQMDVVDAVIGQRLEHDVEHPLAQISGRRIGGSGRLMSSIAMVTRMLGLSWANSGSAFSGCNNA